MYSPADLAFWIVAVLLEAFACGLLAFRGKLRSYRMLALYFAGCVLCDLARAETLLRHGFASVQYQYLFFYGECFSTILLYLAVVEHCERVIASKTARKHLRMASFVLAACLGAFCYLVVMQSSARLAFHLVAEYSQNLFLATAAFGLLLLLLSLWKKEVSMHDRLLALVLASYPLMASWQYFLRNLYPSHASAAFYSTMLWWILLPLEVAAIFSHPATAEKGPYLYL